MDAASLFFFFNDTATTEIYTLSLHDALPIYDVHELLRQYGAEQLELAGQAEILQQAYIDYYFGLLRQLEHDIRSEEHTSELQSRLHLVCRLLLEKKKNETSERRQATDMYIIY